MKTHRWIVTILITLATIVILPVAVLVFQESWRLFWLAFPGLLVTGIIQNEISFGTSAVFTVIIAAIILLRVGVMKSGKEVVDRTAQAEEDLREKLRGKKVD